jgi:hypothetical protein
MGGRGGGRERGDIEKRGVLISLFLQWMGNKQYDCLNFESAQPP